MSTPIKSNLFNFVTLRSPQAIGDKNVTSTFISFPAGQESQNLALNAISNTSTDEEKNTALLAAYQNGFSALETRFAIKQQYADLHNFAMWLGRNKASLSYENISANIFTTSAAERLETALELWNQLFCNIILKKSTTIRDILIQLLIANNFLNEFDQFVPFLDDTQSIVSFTDEQKESYTRIANASLIVPQDIIITDNEISTNDGTITASKSTTENSETLYGVTELGIADFRRVEQEVCCYVPGEVSHIENIMAREYKERSTRNLRVSETTTETTTETEIENLTDTTSTERSELNTEASSIVNEDNSTSFGANASVNGNFGNISFTAGSNFNTSTNNSTSDANSQAQTYAQEVTERALERVVQKVSSKRTSRILQEFEENNTHGFDNRKGDEHVSGVYRWVDKIYKNKLVNYGKRLMYEFALPEPAKFFIDSYLKDNTTKTESNLIIPNEPINPAYLPEKITDASSLTESNFSNVLSRYRAEFIEYPEETIIINKPFQIDFLENGDQEGNSISDEVEIPEGYIVDSFVINGNLFSNNDGDNNGSILLSAGNEQTAEYKIHGHFTLESKSGVSANIKDSLAISASTYDTLTCSFNAIVTCKRTSGGLLKWQNDTYKAILDAYNERVQEYNDFITSQTVEEEVTEEKKELSSQLNRSIEKRELKRMAIDLMTAPYGITTTGDHYDSNSSVILSEDKSSLQKHIEVVKFFEQAFDWEIMAYTFYPYFYKNNWNDAFEYIEGNDPIFKAFLQSGMARSVVPVTPGFENAVNWYMQTGEVWNGTGMITDANDELYVSIAEEMQTVEGEVEGTWETRVPTTLTVLQANAVILDEGGLPCDPDCDEETLFKSSSSLLTSEDEEEPEGVDFDIVGSTNDIE